DSHLIHKVIVNGKAYIADVAFGVSFQIWEPMELVSGKDQHQEAGVFRVLDKGDKWVLEKTSRKTKVLNPDFAKSSLVKRQETTAIYCFTLEPREVEHFYEANNTLQTDPKSLFMNKSIVSLQTATGFRALVGWTYSEVTFKPEEGVDVFDLRNIEDEEKEQVLLEKFDIKLQKKLQLVSNKTCYSL
ncbi:arylamine N-acetyltransferase, pineal gland isozyme NAT-10, partial [Notothenia coriiceps]|uniref:arylamine N-acetyltransferase n=1 Tax=Notothenia coriiceps TaxID=8208 RepID=A0A6I9NX59_9TELE